MILLFLPVIVFFHFFVVVYIAFNGSHSFTHSLTHSCTQWWYTCLSIYIAYSFARLLVQSRAFSSSSSSFISCIFAGSFVHSFIRYCRVPLTRSHIAIEVRQMRVVRRIYRLFVCMYICTTYVPYVRRTNRTKYQCNISIHTCIQI